MTKAEQILKLHAQREYIELDDFIQYISGCHTNNTNDSEYKSAVNRYNSYLKRNNLTKPEPVTAAQFCLRKTNVAELCVIRDAGYICAVAWIDHEDLFTIHPNLAHKIVKKDSWGTLTVVGSDNQTHQVPCHYIDV